MRALEGRNSRKEAKRTDIVGSGRRRSVLRIIACLEGPRKQSNQSVIVVYGTGRMRDILGRRLGAGRQVLDGLREAFEEQASTRSFQDIQRGR